MAAEGKIDRASVGTIVRGALTEVLVQFGDGDGATVSESTRLLGKGSVVDSIGLVALVVDVERRVQQATGMTVTVADERAMSQRNSPFLSVGTLTDYVVRLLQQHSVP